MNTGQNNTYLAIIYKKKIKSLVVKYINNNKMEVHYKIKGHPIS